MQNWILRKRKLSKWIDLSLASQTKLIPSLSLTTVLPNSEEFLVSTANAGPLVNPSLMFFSTRPYSESLKLLASAPGMEPRALEILLRNWRHGGETGECIMYAKSFLQQSQYCQAIVGVNWTRWNHSDETLFDLVDQNVSYEERSSLTKALLRADLRFQHDLAPLNAPWAARWREALRQTDWFQAKGLVLGLDAGDRLRECAFAVLAERLLVKEVESIWSIRSRPTGPDGTFVPAEREYALILQDSQEPKVELDERFAKYLLGFFHD